MPLAYLRAEVVYAVVSEGALHLDDIMHRRTRLVYEYPNAGALAVDEIVAIVAPLLGWNATQIDQEVSVYRAGMAATAEAAAAPDDEAATRARSEAIDIIAMKGARGANPT